jgi:predicted glycosyltransferase involved in capsule biosynthesis
MNNINTNFFLDSKLNNVEVNKKVAVVIPWRPTPSRVRLFSYLIDWYSREFPLFKIITSDSNDKIFNAAASRNLGIKKAFEEGNDLVICSDSDVFVSKDSIIKSILNAIDTNNITVPYTELRKLTQEGTEQFLKNNKNSFDMLEKVVPRPILNNDKAQRFWPCGGIIIITKSLFEEFGGMDESYVGWGVEDIDYQKRYLDTYGKLFDYIDGSIISLYHSREEWMNPDSRNIEIFKSKYKGDYIF